MSITTLPSPTDVMQGINQALNVKASNLATVNNLNQQLSEAKKALIDAKNAILNEYNDTTKHPDGQKELGSNEASRNAAIESMTQTERSKVEAIEGKMILAQGDLSVALVECDRWRYTLRLLEVDSRLD